MQHTPVDNLRMRHKATLVVLERYRLLVESVQDYAIFLLDADGTVQTWNEGAERNKGYKPEEIIGKHFSTFYLERDKLAKKPERELELARRFGRVEDEDWRVRKDGSQFWANVVITALYDEDGELVGFAKVTRDLTERKLHEDALRDANTRLRAQQRELERLNLSKDEFISLASHQLRTPATSIKQYLGMIIEGFLGAPDPKHLDFLKKAYDSNEHQLAIVNSLLQVAQIDSGRVILQKMPVDIARLLHDVADENAESFRARRQKVVITVPKKVPSLVIDRRYVRMALENLVDNASKYTPAGGNITLSARADTVNLYIVIADTGVGIASEDVGKLFKKFTRIPNKLSDSVGGSGLGLYWVEKVVELHEGMIAVTSQQGAGTTFTITLPLRGSDA